MSGLVARSMQALERMTLRRLLATPKPRSDGNNGAQEAAEMPLVRGGEETSNALFEAVFDAIVRGDHSLLIGPRGSGKSYAARKAINWAESRDSSGAKSKSRSVLVPGAQITAQGNKEMPRDYFFEPEFEFVREGGITKSVTMSIRQPPLLRNARLDAQKNIELALVKGSAEGSNMVSRYLPKLEHAEGRNIREIGKFVLFLDEINRFNDGVLDSLLLLLEEKCIIYQGKVVELPVVVVATMNPPGYDLSARSLSPPLMSRFNIVKQLYTAGPKTLVHTILPSQLPLTEARRVSMQYEIFAMAILSFWGESNPKRPSGAYLSPDAVKLLDMISAKASEDFRRHLKFVSEKSNYGPDARGTRDWMMAVDRRLRREFDETDETDRDESDNRERLARIAVEELGDAVANKLVLNFSPEARPDDYRQLMASLGALSYELFTNETLRGIVRENLAMDVVQ